MKISVIIPVYNAGNYLKKCMTSVINQTYPDWEMILVDDGSKDGSGNIIDIAAAKDERIKAIHQENAGPGAARNRGIEGVAGDFVVFLDADDYIEHDYFDLLASRAVNNDLIFIDAEQKSIDGKVIKEEKMSVYKGWRKDRILRSQMTGKLPWGGVRKAVSIRLLKDNRITFTSHSIGEEALYSFRVLHAAESISFIEEKPVYSYIIHEGSQSGLQIDDPWGDVVKCLKEYLFEQGIYEEYGSTVNAFGLTALVVSLDRINRMYDGREKKQRARERIVQFHNLYDKSAGVDYRNMSYKARVFAPFLLHDIYWPVMLASQMRLRT